MLCNARRVISKLSKIPWVWSFVAHMSSIFIEVSGYHRTVRMQLSHGSTPSKSNSQASLGVKFSSVWVFDVLSAEIVLSGCQSTDF